MAPDFDTLFKIEDAMNTALYSMISSSVANAYIPRGTQVNHTPAVNASFLITTPLKHMAPIYNESGSVVRYYPDIYEGNVAVAVVTERATNDSSHAGYVGACRRIFQDYHNYNTYLTYHKVLNVLNQNSATAIEEQSNHDMTLLNFTIHVCIKPDAWCTGSFA